MLDTSKFAGKTVFISGASRGIGKAIALKLAKHGANIIVAAKTTKQHAKLPGTIYTAVEEIQKMGGEGLACPMDIRNEVDVEKAVQTAVKKFGCIDVLINNASAISLTGTLETPMKKFDLMHYVNVRGTFLLSQKCIPHLKNSENPHILNLSPPLLMESQWFSRHVAYTMAKYGMSMCVLGMCEELKKYKIGVNALWPQTAIWTAAMEVLGTQKSVCRKPEIVADAAYAILLRNSQEFTGNFLTDEEVLKQEGVHNFDKYAYDPGVELMQDFFLPGRKYEDILLIGKKSGTMQQQNFSKQEPFDEDGEEQGSTNKSKEERSEKKLEFAAYDIEIRSVLLKLREVIDESLVGELQAIFQFQFRDSTEAPFFFIDAKNGKGYVSEGISKDIDVAFEIDKPTFLRIFHKQLSPVKAFFDRNLRVKGDMAKAILLKEVVKKINRS